VGKADVNLLTGKVSTLVLIVVVLYPSWKMEFVVLGKIAPIVNKIAETAILARLDESKLLF
jgi:hypothetical protein